MARYRSSFHMVLALLLMLIQSSHCGTVHQRHSNNEDPHNACSLVTTQSHHESNVTPAQGILHISLCVGENFFHPTNNNSQQTLKVSSSDSQRSNQLDIVAAVAHDDSLMCVGSVNSTPNGNASFDLAVTQDLSSWPISIILCRSSVNNIQEKCFTVTIAHPNGVLSAKEPGQVIVKATAQSTAENQITYEAHLNLCGTKQRFNNENGKIQLKMQPRPSTSRSANVSRRMRRDLIANEESAVDAAADNHDGKTGEDAELQANGNLFRIYARNYKLGDEMMDTSDEVEWVKRNNKPWRQAMEKLLGQHHGASSNVLDEEGKPEKRKWKNSGMQWIKRGDDSDTIDDDEDDNESAIDEQNLNLMGDYADTKRKWGKSPMGWVKRKWANTGMSWIKRFSDAKRKWKNSAMQWVKK